MGSATVAGITAAGLTLPLIAGSNISPELMVIATGAGSLMFSHFNDIGFWMFKEYFNATVKQTFAIWTVMETTIGIIGLIGVLLLSKII
jgi:Gnt-I system high-affinity gluconate transporter